MTAVLANVVVFDGLDFYNRNEGVHVNDVVCMKLDVVLVPPLPVDSIIIGIGYTLVADPSSGDKSDSEPVSAGRTMPEECPDR